MKFFEKAIKAAHGPKESIIDALKKSLGKSVPARSHKHIHASDLTKENFCPREVALLDMLKLERKPETVPTAMRVTFDVGTLTAKIFCEQWLVDKVVGNWMCLRCGKHVPFSKRPPEKEPTTDCKHRWEYEEVRFIDHKYMYSGGIDCILDLGAPLLTVVELKIMAPEKFAEIVAPLGEHRLRTNLYMNLIENSDHPHKAKVNTKWAKVLYVSRGFGKKSESGEILPFKEFDVERKDEDLDTPLAKAEAVKLFRTKGVLPARICEFSYSPVAKGCVVCTHCFSGKYH